jgi:Tol biopolymer transport system component
MVNTPSAPSLLEAQQAGSPGRRATPVAFVTLGIAGLLVLTWMGSTILTLRRIGLFPPRTTLPTLAILGGAFAFLGALLVARSGRTARIGFVALLMVIAVIAPLSLGTWVPGIAQLKVYPIPGAPTIVVSAHPYGNSDLWLINGAKVDSHTRLTNTPETIELWPSLSPDGRQVVYTSDASGDDAIWLMTLDAAGRPTSERRLISGSRTDMEPVWSPDGERILYSSLGTHSDIIESYDVSSGKQTQLTPTSGINLNPDWSPDGRQIAFTSSASDGSTEIWVMNADGSGRHRLIPGVDSAHAPNGHLTAT